MLPLFCIAGVKRLCVESSSMVYWWKFTCQLIEAIVKLGKCQHGQTVVRSTILVRCWFSAWYLIFASRSKTIENRCCWCCEQIPCACVGEKERERERTREGWRGIELIQGQFFLLLIPWERIDGLKTQTDHCISPFALFQNLAA